MNKIKFVFIFVLTVLLIAGCGSGDKKKITGDGKATENTDAVIDDDMVESTGSDEVEVPEGEKPLNVLFVGNSLIYWGGIHDHFKLLCKANDKDVSVNTQFIGGSSLDEHFEPLSQNPDLTENTDIVIFNGVYSDDQITLVRDFQALFPEDTEFYLLYTEYNNCGYDASATFYKEIENLKFIPSGLAHDLLIEKGVLTYKQLHSDFDYHPNYLYGYIGALSAYGEIFGEKCAELSLNVPLGNVSMIPGKTEEDRAKRLDGILTAVDEAVAADLYQTEANRYLVQIENSGEAVTADALKKIFNLEVMDNWDLKSSNIVSLGTEKIHDNEYLVAVGYKTNYTNAEYDWLYLITMLYYKFDGEAARIDAIERYYLPHKLTAESEEFKSDLVTTPQINIDINEVNAAGESLSSYYINFIFDETVSQFGAGKYIAGEPENIEGTLNLPFEISVDEFYIR